MKSNLKKWENIWEIYKEMNLNKKNRKNEIKCQKKQNNLEIRIEKEKRKIILSICSTLRIWMKIM